MYHEHGKKYDVFSDDDKRSCANEIADGIIEFELSGKKLDLGYLKNKLEKNVDKVSFESSRND